MVSSHRILHLSDTHATASASGVNCDEDGVDALCGHFQLLHARDPQVGQEVYVVDPITWQPVPEEP